MPYDEADRFFELLDTAVRLWDTNFPPDAARYVLGMNLAGKIDDAIEHPESTISSGNISVTAESLPVGLGARVRVHAGDCDGPVLDEAVFTPVFCQRLIQELREMREQA